MTCRGLAVAVLLAFTPGCHWLTARAKKPEVVLEKVDLTDVDFQQAKLRADLRVKNKIPVVVKLARVNWKVKIDADELVTGVIENALDIPANGELPVQIPFALKFEDLYRIQQKLKDQDTAPFRFEGTLQVETPVGPVKLPFHHDGTVPVLHIPQVEVAKIEVKGVTMSGADIRLGFRVKNPNGIALDLQSLDYALSVAGAEVANGALPSALNVPPKGQGTFDADVKVSFLKAQEAAQAITTKSSAQYSLKGNLAAATPWGKVSTPYVKSGSVKIQK